jgi:hypothetical protein
MRKGKRPADPPFGQVTGRLRRWWQVMDSNQRRLSRRFYRPVLLYPAHVGCLRKRQPGPANRVVSSAMCPCPAPGRPVGTVCKTAAQVCCGQRERCSATAGAVCRHEQERSGRERERYARPLRLRGADNRGAAALRERPTGAPPAVVSQYPEQDGQVHPECVREYIPAGPGRAAAGKCTAGPRAPGQLAWVSSSAVSMCWLMVSDWPSMQWA